MNQEPTRISIFDHLLAFGAAALAVYAAGMGLNTPDLSRFFVVILAFGTLFSFGMHNALRNSKWLQLDGVLFVIIGAVAIFGVQGLNAILPEGGFPRTLIVASMLCWMLALWSFAMWRDSTLLFPCVPAVAIFSLVGSWDSYKGSTLTFFGFLLCFAVLFSRAQRRTMAYRAREAGLSDLRQLSLGPWKWMAGPEWALGSAAAVVVLSLLGAPLIQSSVSGVAGFVAFNVPRPQQRPSSTPGASSVDPISGTTSVGRGPIGELDERPIFRVTMDEARYLRTRTYDLFTGRGWRALDDFSNGFERRLSMGDENSLFNLGRKSITNPKRLEFMVQFLVGINDSVPLPGELSRLDAQGSQSYAMRPDGTVRTMAFENRRRSVGGEVLVDAGSRPVKSNRILGGLYNGEDGMDLVPLTVRQFAQEAVIGAKTDYEKARAIKAAIERQCKYNLKAPAIPSGENAVEAFLFKNREGYCDLFATAMTVCARVVGLPARYVQGYLPFAGDMEQGAYVVRDADYHAWCEILFDDSGWVVMDATEGAEAVPGGERGRGTKDEPLTNRNWFKILLGSLGAVLLVWISTLGLSWAKAYRIAQTPRREVGKIYEAFSRTLEPAAGRARRPSETPSEYFLVAREALGTFAQEAESLSFELERALFAGAVLDDVALRALRQRVSTFRKSVPRKSIMKA